MQKRGRKVPPRIEYESPEDVMAEIDMHIRNMRLATNEAYQAISGMPLNRVAISLYKKRAHESSLARYNEWRRSKGWQAVSIDDEPDELAAFVYLLESNGTYKIGVSTDVERRVHALQTGNPFPIRIVDFMITMATRINEQEIHKHFAHRRLAGEWFALSADEVETVRGWFRNGIPTFLGGKQ